MKAEAPDGYVLRRTMIDERGWTPRMCQAIFAAELGEPLIIPGGGKFTWHAYPLDVVSTIEADERFAKAQGRSTDFKRGRKRQDQSQVVINSRPTYADPAKHIEAQNDGCAAWTGLRADVGQLHWSVIGGMYHDRLPVFPMGSQGLIAAVWSIWQTETGLWPGVGYDWSWSCGSSECVEIRHIRPTDELTRFYRQFLSDCDLDSPKDDVCWVRHGDDGTTWLKAPVARRSLVWMAGKLEGIKVTTNDPPRTCETIGCCSPFHVGEN